MKSNEVREIYADLIDLPERQMRRDIDRDELHNLAENIKQNGLINPITVRAVGERFELVAGQRRLLACGIARIYKIPCVIMALTDAAAVSVMAAENLERRDVDVVDEANFVSIVMNSLGLTVVEMAERLNRGEQYVKDRIAIAQMPEYMQAYLKSGELKLGAALALMEIEPDEKRRLWVGLAVQDNASVRVVDYWVYQHKLGTLPESVTSPDDVPGAPEAAYRAPMFRCAVDGKEYPAQECEAVFVYKGNREYLNAFREELGRAPGEVSVPVGGNA